MKYNNLFLCWQKSSAFSCQQEGLPFIRVSLYLYQLVTISSSTKRKKTDKSTKKVSFSDIYHGRLQARADAVKLPKQVLLGFGCYHSNDFRKVYPYHSLSLHSIENVNYGVTLLNFLRKYNFFENKSDSQLSEKLQNEEIFINGKEVDLDYRLHAKDVFGFWTHRHEMPVLHSPIEVVHECADLLVINKPSSYICHPSWTTTLYYTTLLKILEHDFGYKGLHIINRLDRGTSGLIIFAKTGSVAKTLAKQIQKRNVQKTYLAMVVGEFPKRKIICEEPLYVNLINDDLPVTVLVNKPEQGYVLKQCKTIFERISCNGSSSLLKCTPVTGRTHQIRVHLQYLGHPIVNDEVYNSPAFGPYCAKGGIYHDSISNIRQAIKCFQYEKYDILDNTEAVTRRLTEIKLLEPFFLDEYNNFSNNKVDRSFIKDGRKFLHVKLPEYEEQLWFPMEDCLNCQKFYTNCKPEDLCLYLHALRYEGPDWKFSTLAPEWINEDLNALII